MTDLLKTERFLRIIAASYKESVFVALVDHFCGQAELSFCEIYRGHQGLDTTFPLRILRRVWMNDTSKLPPLTRLESAEFNNLFQPIVRENTAFLRRVFSR